MREDLEIEGKRVLVVGLARSGLASANLLAGRGAMVTATDLKDRSDLEKAIGVLDKTVKLSLGGHSPDDFKNADWIVISPGVPSDTPELQAAIAMGIPVYSEVELAYRLLEGSFIGVTGSNGKTTTATLIGELLSSAGVPCRIAGNIGLPLVGWVEKAKPGERVTYVVELSSFQLENIDRFRCHIGLILNVTPDHQDRYPGFGEYREAKERIFRNQTGEDYAVLNADDPHTRKMAEGRAARTLLFSRTRPLDQGVFVDRDMIAISWEREKQPLMRIEEVGLKGAHNLENVLAAAAVGTILGVPRQTMCEVFKTFPGVEHRLEWVRERGGVSYFNDSKATNLESVRQGLAAFDRPLIVIMGGRDKGADFSVLESLVGQKVKRLVLLGEAAGRIERALGGVVGTSRAGGMGEAVRLAAGEASPGDVVLLCPGCSSFDMFEDFEDRGRMFKREVADLPDAVPGRGEDR